MESRESLIKKVTEISLDNPFLLLSWATRVGKTPAALSIINQIGGKWNIVVAETVHIKQWREEFIKFGMENMLKHVNIFCYPSIKKYEDYTAQWVFDEAHHLLGEKTWETVKAIYIKRAILLSATVYERELMTLRSKFPTLIIDKVSLNQAIEWKILHTPQIIVIPLLLSDKMTELHFTYGKPPRENITCNFSEYQDKIITSKAANLTIKCTLKEKYKLLDREVEIYKNAYNLTKSESYKRKFLRSGLKRKNFLTEIKTDFVGRTILPRLEGRRLMVFAGSLEQCRRLVDNKYIVNSFKTPKVNNAIIEAFNKKKIDKLFAFKMLREGTNLFNVDVGIIIQLDSKSRSFIQRSGRVYLGEKPMQVILYVKNTKDEDYVFSALEGIDESLLYITRDYIL